MRNAFGISLLLLLSAVACFAQTSFQGITPGKSTKADVARVLGPPVQRFSATLIEYKPQQEADKIYVQYGDGSPDAIVERIEVTCTHDGWGMTTPNSLRCGRWQDAIQGKYKVDMSDPDAFKKSDNPTKTTYYFGSPRFIVNSTKYLSGSLQQTESWGFYSSELFENAAPMRGCTGTILGDWETNHGHMTVVRDGDPILDKYGTFRQPIKGTYSQNHGTFTGTRTPGVLEWKDDTGTGTMWMNVLGVVGGDTFAGEWGRDTGRGPAKGKWTGRCVNAGSAND